MYTTTAISYLLQIDVTEANFDLVFVYKSHKCTLRAEWLLHYLRRYGKVADASVTDKQTEALRALNAKLLADPRISFSLVPVGDGMALCRKK